MLQRPGIKQYTQHTDREVTANRPDTISTNKKVKTCILIDVAIPVDRICNAKGSGKGAKIQEFMYTDTRNVEHEMIIPVKTGVTGIGTKGLRTTLEAIPGKHLTESLQKTAELGISHVIRRVLQSET